MSTIRFSNGVSVKFDGTPTQADIEEVARRIESAPSAQPPKQAGLIQRLADFDKNAKRQTTEFGKGVLKGVASTLSGASEIGQRYALKLLERLLTGGKSYTGDVVSLPKHLTEASNTAQRLGKGAEQIAEYFIPGAAPAKAAKFVGALPKIANAGTLARFTAPTLTQAGANAALFGGQTAIQEGEFGQKSADTARIGGQVSAALSLLGPVGKLIGKGSRGMAIRTANSALGETATKRLPGVKSGAPSLGEDILKEGYGFGTTKGLQQQFQARADKIDDQLTALLGQKQFASHSVAKSELKPYLSNLFKQAKNAFGERDVRVAALKRIIADIPDNMSLPQSNVVKRELYDAARNAFTNPNAGITPQGQKAIARGIRTLIEKKTTFKKPMSIDEFNRLSPEDQVAFNRGEYTPTAGINRRLGIASRASDQLAKRVAQREGQALVNIPDILTGIGGFAAGGPMGAVGLPVLRRIVSSPAGRLAIAKILYGAERGTTKMSQSMIYKALQRVGLTQATDSALR